MSDFIETKDDVSVNLGFEWEQRLDARRNTVIFGFDSAWMDNPKAPGAICSLGFDRDGQPHFLQPRLVNFAEALDFIASERERYETSLVALDQPTIVPNEQGCRPVERVAGTLISFVGGGVQPANRGKAAMFGNDAPVWRFLSALNARQDPVAAQSARQGTFLIEVFPALALPAFEPAFAQRLGAPKYNPANRKKFRQKDWRSVASVIANLSENLGVAALARWIDAAGRIEHPKKADQDRLDAAICVLIGLIWREASMPSIMLGDLENGYMICPVSPTTQKRLECAALARQVNYRLIEAQAKMPWMSALGESRPSPSLSGQLAIDGAC